MGKYWQMHNKLYQENVTYYSAQQTGSTYNTWINASNPLPDFDSYAKQLGLNVTQFNNYYNSSQVNNAIEADMTAGNNLNVQGTPTFFLNGKNIGNPATLSGFEKEINAAIANNGKVSSTTTKNTTNQTKK
jgi:2-hydroxychromene-2-carboxylate isomerase